MIVLLLLNANARRGEDFADEIVQQFSDNGLSVNCKLTRSVDQARHLLRQHAESADIIVVGGGDGSINALLPDLVEISKPVGIIPLGTANDFARSLGIPENPAEAIRLIANGREKQVDIGVADGRMFLNAVNIGLGEQVAAMHEKDGRAKRIFGFAAYPIHWLGAWRKGKGHVITASVKIDGQPAEDFRAAQISVTNADTFGRHFSIDANSAVDSGRLSVARLHPRGLFAWMKLLPRLLNGQVNGSPDAVVQKAKSVNIETRPASRYSADGESLGTTPVGISIRPQALTVIVPA